MSLLAEDEIAPVTLLNAHGASPYVLICEHASQRLPRKLGKLGLSDRDLNAHIAWDLGAAATALRLAEILDAPLVLQNYSRLVYDCNRPPEAPDAMPKISELTIIPGNQNLEPQDRLERIKTIYRPFHDAVSNLLDERASQSKPTSLISIHSFTPVYKGVTRHLDCGLLFDREATLAQAIAKNFSTHAIRFNEPYGPEDGVLHTLNLHAASRGLQSVMVEIRNNLISNEEEQNHWASDLASALLRAR